MRTLTTAALGDKVAIIVQPFSHSGEEGQRGAELTCGGLRRNFVCPREEKFERSDHCHEGEEHGGGHGGVRPTQLLIKQLSSGLSAICQCVRAYINGTC